jgi:uncharacterized phage protein gp47/JayE
MAAPVEVPTFSELYELARAAALQRTAKLSDLSWSPGYMADVLTGLTAAIAEEAVRFSLELHRKTFFETAEGEDLDTLAEDHFGIERQGGEMAIGEVTFSRATTAAGNVLIPAGTRVSTPDGLLFATTEEILLTGLSLDAAIEALEVGEEGIVDAGTITVLVDKLLADSSIGVTNAERTAGGIKAETDSDFRARLRGYLATVRRGTVSALAFGATQVAGVLQASVDETNFPPTVYIADFAGSANSALIAAVQAELDNWRPAGTQVNVVGATVVNQAIALTLTFAAGSDTAAARDQAIDAVVAAVNALGIGETLFRAQIIAAAGAVAGVKNVVVSNPSGDVVPTASQLIRTTHATVNVV